MMRPAPLPSAQTEDACTSALSALVDGEATPHEVDEVLASLASSDDEYAQWNRYQVIGDVLRQSAPAAAARSPQAFLAGIQAELQRSEKPTLALAPTETGRTPATPPVGQGRTTAANDTVFRWKMAAGFASLAAVMAVSWTQLQGTAEVPGGAASGTSLAQQETPFELASVEALIQQAAATEQTPVVQDPVVVQAPQGPVMRDPQLEALMDQHRQHGGLTALQLPTVFLRNATYDAPTR